MIAGIKATSLIDYPGKIAAVVYLSRCSFRCPFCHNRQLVLEEDLQAIPEEQVLQTLSSRQDFIDGVVITGGEPTLSGNLHGLINSIKALGFPVKLDTNGYNPEVLEKLINSRAIDFIAMDIKTAWHKYYMATGIAADTRRLIASVSLIKDSGIDHEFRTTCVPAIIDREDIEIISRLVGHSSGYTLQQFQPENTLDSSYEQITPYPVAVLKEFLEIARRNTAPCRLIGIKQEIDIANENRK
jgi:pyruvate formate lyase activating enzyme